MTDEVIEKIKDDLETAAYIDRLLPPVRAPRYRCCMPLNLIISKNLF